MRKVIFQMMISLDGYFEGPERDISWHNVDEEFNNYAIDLLNNVDTLLFGRITYQLMAEYWPSQEAITNDPIVAERMNSLAKITFSRTLDKVEWKNSRLVKGTIPEEIMKLKKQAGKDIALFGSSNLALTFIEHNLIDEFRIMVNPVVLGKGTPLFNGIKEKLPLKLIKSKTFDSGNVLLYYSR
jgi:dihydrofolate reductase